MHREKYHEELTIHKCMWRMGKSISTDPKKLVFAT